MRLTRVTAAIFASSMLLVGLPATFAGAATADVTIVDFAFEPDDLQVAPGDSVTFTNTGIADHTVTADDGSQSNLLRAGQSVTIDFATAQFFAYYCKFHGGPGGNGMSGSVTVGDPPVRQDPVELSATSGVGAAIAWSKLTFPDGGADFALLARDDVFADALSSGGAQGALGGPLLLTPTASLADETKAELARLGVTRVLVLGGPNAVSQNVVTQLEAAGYAVERIAGGSRVETAIALGDRVLPAARSAILARAFAGTADPTQAFADALGAGALASATGQPILLTDTAALSPSTKAYLQSHPIKSITVAGGPGAVSDAVVTELEAMGIEVDRAAGTGRAGTALELAFRGPGGGTVVLVDGSDPAGWTSGFPAAALGAPVLLTQGADVPDETVIFLVSSGLELVCAPNVAPAACDKADAAATAGDLFIGAAAFAVLEGGNEVPDTGDVDATGAATFAGTNSPTAFCYQYFTSAMTEAKTAAHIHEAAEGVAGPPVVTLSTSPAFFDPSTVMGCVFGVDAGLVTDILSNPADYYINVHTATFPGGAIRGQLFAPESIFLVDLAGEADQPGPGDLGGVGFGIVLVKGPAEVCVDVSHSGLASDPVASHIHDGDAGTAGPPVLALDTPNADGSGPTRCYTVADSDTQTGAEIVDAIQADPNGFYLNVHTVDHPGGAIRGQLLDPFGVANRAPAASSGAALAGRSASRWYGAS